MNTKYNDFTSPKNKNLIINILQKKCPDIDLQQEFIHKFEALVEEMNRERVNYTNIVEMNKKFLKICLEEISDLRLQIEREKYQNLNMMTLNENTKKRKADELEQRLREKQEEMDMFLKQPTPPLQPTFEDNFENTKITNMEDYLKKAINDRENDIMNITRTYDQDPKKVEQFIQNPQPLLLEKSNLHTPHTTTKNRDPPKIKILNNEVQENAFHNDIIEDKQPKSILKNKDMYANPNIDKPNKQNVSFKMNNTTNLIPSIPPNPPPQLLQQPKTQLSPINQNYNSIQADNLHNEIIEIFNDQDTKWHTQPKPQLQSQLQLQPLPKTEMRNFCVLNDKGFFTIHLNEEFQKIKINNIILFTNENDIQHSKKLQNNLFLLADFDIENQQQPEPQTKYFQISKLQKLLMMNKNSNYFELQKSNNYIEIKNSSLIQFSIYPFSNEKRLFIEKMNNFEMVIIDIEIFL